MRAINNFPMQTSKSFICFLSINKQQLNDFGELGWHHGQNMLVKYATNWEKMKAEPVSFPAQFLTVAVRSSFSLCTSCRADVRALASFSCERLSSLVCWSFCRASSVRSCSFSTWTCQRNAGQKRSCLESQAILGGIFNQMCPLLLYFVFFP